MGDEFLARRMRGHFSDLEIFDLRITVGHLMAFGRLTAVLRLGQSACSITTLNG